MKKERKTLIAAVMAAIILPIILWGIFYIEELVGMSFSFLGVLPRTLKGIPGIVTHVLVHGNLEHLANNTWPLFVLGWMLFYFFPTSAKKVYFIGWLLTGIGIWLFARENYHIGASGLVYMLAFFVWVSSIIRRDIARTAVALLVTFLYGSLWWGMLPIQEGVSFEGHISGAVAGILLAIYFRKTDLVPKPQWYEEEPESEFKYQYKPDDQ